MHITKHLYIYLCVLFNFRMQWCFTRTALFCTVMDFGAVCCNVLQQSVAMCWSRVLQRCVIPHRTSFWHCTQNSNTLFQECIGTSEFSLLEECIFHSWKIVLGTFMGWQVSVSVCARHSLELQHTATHCDSRCNTHCNTHCSTR